VEATPYTGAGMSLLIEDEIGDWDCLAEQRGRTEAALPTPDPDASRRQQSGVPATEARRS